MRGTGDRYRTLPDASSAVANQPTVKVVLHSLIDHALACDVDERKHDTRKLSCQESTFRFYASLPPARWG